MNLDQQPLPSAYWQAHLTDGGDSDGDSDGCSETSENSRGVVHGGGIIAQVRRKNGHPRCRCSDVPFQRAFAFSTCFLLFVRSSGSVLVLAVTQRGANE